MTDPIRKPRLDGLLDYLLTRRSLSSTKMTGPGPNDAELEAILRAATRVPDHGKLAPWRIQVVRGEAQHTLGKRWAGDLPQGQPRRQRRTYQIRGETASPRPAAADR
ncbi:MAG: hypothetical protein HND48_07995 [Chloroflexi bacterium]|nr:hypothetical protein [Chloroflexota bacterium]